MKRRGYVRPLDGYHPIHMPKNTEAGVVLAGFSVAFGVAMIWYVWWLAAISFVGIIGYAIFHTFNFNRDYYISAEEVLHTETERTRLLSGEA
jgi:cytochrome o ubiquinol oxidase subunit 1